MRTIDLLNRRIFKTSHPKEKIQMRQTDAVQS
jgi:hypothetical protein